MCGQPSRCRAVFYGRHAAGFGTETEDEDLESHFCQASMIMFAQLMLCLSAAEPYCRKKITYAAAAAPRHRRDASRAADGDAPWSPPRERERSCVAVSCCRGA